MGAIKQLLKRWGYAKLDEFGLVLTAEDRIVATRPAVLDDGIGARVVGWRDSDLAAIELAPWRPPASPMTARRRVTASAAPARVAGPMPEPAAPARVADRMPEPVAPARPVMPEPVPPIDTAAPPEDAPEHAIEHAIEHTVEPAPPVRPEPVVVEPAITVERAGAPPDEDEWEWEIAMARARAAAEWIEEAITPPTTLPAASSSWLAVPLAPPVQPGNVPKTVIPVPQLPPAVDPRVVARSMPVRARSHRPSNQVARATPSSRQLAARR
jgi:hypothetical protein